MELKQQFGNDLATNLEVIESKEKVFEFDVFLNYSSKDKNAVHTLAFMSTDLLQ